MLEQGQGCLSALLSCVRFSRNESKWLINILSEGRGVLEKLLQDSKEGCPGRRKCDFGGGGALARRCHVAHLRILYYLGLRGIFADCGESGCVG